MSATRPSAPPPSSFHLAPGVRPTPLPPAPRAPGSEPWRLLIPGHRHRPLRGLTQVSHARCLRPRWLYFLHAACSPARVRACACVRIAQSPPQGQEQGLSTQLSCVPTPGVAPVSDTEANGGKMNGRGRRPQPAESNARGDDSRKKTRCPEVNNFSPRPTASNVPGPLPASTQSRVCTESKSSPTKSLPLCHRRLEELTAREDDLISLHNTE